jgi:hypothetical protein
VPGGTAVSAEKLSSSDVLASVLPLAAAPTSISMMTLPAVFRGCVDASATMVRYLSDDGFHDDQTEAMVTIVERMIPYE